jgi:hypothetical protein
VLEGRRPMRFCFHLEKALPLLGCGFLLRLVSEEGPDPTLLLGMVSLQLKYKSLKLLSPEGAFETRKMHALAFHAGYMNGEHFS